MNDALGILNRIDQARTYNLVLANDNPRLYRLEDGERGYSANLSEAEMKPYILGFAMGLEIAESRQEGAKSILGKVEKQIKSAIEAKALPECMENLETTEQTEVIFKALESLTNSHLRPFVLEELYYFAVLAGAEQDDDPADDAFVVSEIMDGSIRFSDFDGQESQEDE